MKGLQTYRRNSFLFCNHDDGIKTDMNDNKA